MRPRRECDARLLDHSGCHLARSLYWSPSLVSRRNAVKNHIQSIAIGAALFTLGGGFGCGSNDDGPLSNVDSLVILQRPKRNDTGDIFQYTSYVAGARLVQLSPPTADGK